MADEVIGGTSYKNLSSSDVIKSGPGYLTGFFVASTTSGTIKFWDNTAGSGDVLINTFTPSAGWNPCPMPFKKGLYATIANTMDVTISYS